MAACAQRKRSRGKTPAAGKKPRASLIVADEERRHLIEDCAFFRAGRFRAVEPGCYRREDLAAVAAEIDAAIRLLGGKGGRKR